MFGPLQITIVILAIVLLFGTKKLPELAKAMRLSVDELKKPKEGTKNLDENSKEKKEEA